MKQGQDLARKTAVAQYTKTGSVISESESYKGKHVKRAGSCQYFLLLSDDVTFGQTWMTAKRKNGRNGLCTRTETRHRSYTGVGVHTVSPKTTYTGARLSVSVNRTSSSTGRFAFIAG